MAINANRLGRYELRREIARSNDVVYEAWDPSVNRRVAIKEMVMPPGVAGKAAQERLQRFDREARAAGRLAHPNIVTIYELGEDSGRHFISMEYLEGPTLREVLQGSNGLPVDQAVQVAVQIAEALDYAHRHGVVHRDVKPDNVHLINPTFPKLTDFGIARIEAESNITLSGQVFGTPSYMSPEQVAGGAIDARTDIFSLGVMLFEMVTGHKPFTGDSVVTITYNIVHETPVIPMSVPEWLAGIIRKALSKDPAGRYESAAEMAEDLRRRHAPYASRVPGAANPNAWGPVLGSAPATPSPNPAMYVPAGRVQPPLPQGIYVFQSADAKKPFPWPRINLPKVSDEAHTFLVALGVTLMVGVLIVVGIWGANQAYDRRLQEQATARVASTLDTARQAYDRKEYAAAIKGYQEALKGITDFRARQVVTENLVNAWVAFGLEQSGSRQLAALRSAERLAPGNPMVHYYLGTYYDEAGDKGTALRYLESVMRHTRDAPQEVAAARPRLARIYLDLGLQANASGTSINGLTDRDWWERASVVDAFGPAGRQAQDLLRSTGG